MTATDPSRPNPWTPAFGQARETIRLGEEEFELTPEGVELRHTDPQSFDQVFAIDGQSPGDDGVEQESAPAKRGDAQTLRDYWSDKGTKHGKRAGIGYDTPPHSDFDECVSRVGKYISDPQGYCALRHKEATGEWPGHAPGERWTKGKKGK